jgi:hydroxypyruvate reductase/glycerate 2-kinase
MSSQQSNSPQRELALTIWRAAVEAADPFAVVRDEVAKLHLPGRVIVLGGGKAGAAMAAGVEAALGDRLDQVIGMVNVPEGATRSLEQISLRIARPAGSNHPTSAGVAATEEQLRLAATALPSDTVICLLSGGGSALLPAPVSEVSLADKQTLTKLLHSCGATIDEMNCVRKHLSRYKGGGLAQVLAMRGVKCHSLIVSDVVGDRLDVIASGPTAADPTTFADALDILVRHRLLEKTPASIVDRFRRGSTGEVAETLKVLPSSVKNTIVANNHKSLLAAQKKAQSMLWPTINLGSFIEGETQSVAELMVAIIRGLNQQGQRVCLLSGGETTVTLPENPGKGGRNQEFVLAVLAKLGETGIAGVTVMSAGTDGEDGPTDAAGAVGDAEVLRRGKAEKIEDYLKRHDAYSYFEKTGGLLRTGLTQTNVMDVRIVLVEGSI